MALYYSHFWNLHCLVSPHTKAPIKGLYLAPFIKREPRYRTFSIELAPFFKSENISHIFLQLLALWRLKRALVSRPPRNYASSDKDLFSIHAHVPVDTRTLRFRSTVTSEFVSSNFIPPYLRTTEPTSSRQPTVSATTTNSAAPPRSPAQVATDVRSGVGGSSDGQNDTSKVRESVVY
jgi:hypothetical protein